MKRLTVIAGLMCLFAFACEQKPEPTPSAAPAAPVAKVAPVAVKVEAPPVALETIPTEEEFEEEAATAVTKASLETQLDALEKEMGSE